MVKYMFNFPHIFVASSRQAGQMSNIRKEKIEGQIESLENKHSKPQAVIKDLVASFLIPNIQKNKLQKKSKEFLLNLLMY